MFRYYRLIRSKYRVRVSIGGRFNLYFDPSATHTSSDVSRTKGPFRRAPRFRSLHLTAGVRKLHSADGSVHFALNYSFAKSQALFAQPTPRLLAELRSAVARHPSHPYFPYHLLIKKTVDIPLSRKLTKDVTTVFSTTTSCIYCI